MVLPRLHVSMVVFVCPCFGNWWNQLELLWLRPWVYDLCSQLALEPLLHRHPHYTVGKQATTVGSRATVAHVSLHSAAPWSPLRHYSHLGRRHSEKTSVSLHPALFCIPPPFALYEHTWSHIVLLLTQWWRDQGQGGPHVPWCSHISVCFMNVVPVSVVLACTLEHECPWETKKWWRITSKPWPERPQPPALSCWYSQALSVENIGNVRHRSAMQMLLNSLIKRQRVVERL